MIQQIQIKKLADNVLLPRKATKYAGAYDVSAPADAIIPHGRSLIKLGFAMQLPAGYCAEIHPRSGYSLKGFEGFAVDDTFYQTPMRYNCDVIHGLIDEDYRGEVGVIINNAGEEFRIVKHQRIAQMLVHAVGNTRIVITDELQATERADGGFGHTGSK